MCRPQDLHVQLHRRRQAAYRLPPLRCCWCQDPWPCDCHDAQPSSDRWVDAGRDAARLLLERGFTPILGGETLRALWRRGGRDRALAQHLYALAGGD